MPKMSNPQGPTVEDLFAIAWRLKWNSREEDQKYAERDLQDLRSAITALVASRDEAVMERDEECADNQSRCGCRFEMGSFVSACLFHQHMQDAGDAAFQRVSVLEEENRRLKEAVSDYDDGDGFCKFCHVLVEAATPDIKYPHAPDCIVTTIGEREA